MKLKNTEKVTGTGNIKKIFTLGMVCCLLTGCGNMIPELTEEEASLIATYAADVVLENSKDNNSRLMDTEEETARLTELSEKVEKLKEKKALEEEEEREEAEQSSGGSGGASANALTVDSIASFIGLPEFQVSYDGYEIKKSYAAEEGDEWEPTFDATSGKNLLIINLKVTNISDAPAVADVLSKDMKFSVKGDQGINGMALVTLLLNDFSFAQDEIGAGESKQYVLIAQIDESITEVNSLSLQMKKGEERAVVTLQ
ncbi:MAG: hypothetical protein HFI07_15515 [Lachnospiraceae bacterium]|nr:hypothetical protein [Lachnospiraceae bacterium]